MKLISTTMDANQTSEVILNLVRKSNLNFNIIESPFSVTITLKKSFIKNKNGTFRKSGVDNHTSENDPWNPPSIKASVHPSITASVASLDSSIVKSIKNNMIDSSESQVKQPKFSHFNQQNTTDSRYLPLSKDTAKVEHVFNEENLELPSSVPFSRASSNVSLSTSSFIPPIPIVCPPTYYSTSDLIKTGPLNTLRASPTTTTTPSTIPPASSSETSSPIIGIKSEEIETESKKNQKPEKEFECAYCSYETNVYNDFLEHINTNHLDSDDDT